MRKYLKVIILLVLVLVTVGYTYYFRPIMDDELFNYGFSVNLLNGLVPYLDFNMIIPPLFSYLLAVVLKIFGRRLIVYHFVIAGFVVGITYLGYRKLGLKAFIIYLLLLFYPYIGYNMFALLLFFLLLNVLGRKESSFYEAILISLMILTKQTLAILVIPNLLYAKKKKKIFCVYGVMGFAFLLYLIVNQNFGEFINYCFLGMFDFTSKNSSSFNLFWLVEIGVLIGLILGLVRTRKKELFYILMFQIMTFPTVNYFHFAISFVPVMYYFLLKFRNNRLVVLESSVLVVAFFLVSNASIYLVDHNYLYYSHYGVDNFMKGRVVNNFTEDYLEKMDIYLDKYQDSLQYILGNFSYLVKLSKNIPITKFDIINNGNMGYHGSYGYIQEIDEDCQRNSCVFIIRDEELTTKAHIQTSREILRYVSENYYREYSSNTFSVYVNDRKMMGSID